MIITSKLKHAPLTLCCLLCCRRHRRRRCQLKQSRAYAKVASLQLTILSCLLMCILTPGCKAQKQNSMPMPMPPQIIMMVYDITFYFINSSNSFQSESMSTPSKLYIHLITHSFSIRDRTPFTAHWVSYPSFSFRRNLN